MSRLVARPIRLLPALLASATLLGVPGGPTSAAAPVVTPACLTAPAQPPVDQAGRPGGTLSAPTRPSAVAGSTGPASVSAWGTIATVGMPGGSAQGAVRLGDRVVFTIEDATHGREPWITDGTEEHTVLLRDIVHGLGTSEPGHLMVAGGRVFFTARTAARGTELWVTDGTHAGTHLVRDIRPGVRGSSPSSLTAFGDKLAFVAGDGVHGREVWVSDGSAAGTRLLRDVAPGEPTSRPRALTGVTRRLFFSAANQLFVSDGSATGTHPLLVAPVRDSMVREIVAWRGRAWFVRYRDTSGGGCARTDEEWLGVSDGRLAGTHLLVRINRDWGPSGVSLVALPDRLVFLGPADNGSARLWRSDGTAAGTRLIRPKGYDGAIAVGANPDRAILAVGARAWFGTDDGDQTWTTDGASYGETQVAGIGTGGENVRLSASSVVPFAGRTWFAKRIWTETAPDEWEPRDELWSTDGTTAGTRLELPLAGGIAALMPMDGWLFALADDGTSGMQPWRIAP